MTDTRPIPNCYWVLPGRFIAGEYPRDLDGGSSESKIAAFLRAGVTSFVNLTSPGDGLEPYVEIVEHLADTDVTLNRFPIRDVSVPSAPSQTAEILDAVDAEIARGGLVYVHCWGGVGRTGTLVGCWLVRHGYSGHDALERVRELWSGCPKSTWLRSPETPTQEDYIINWSETGDGDAGLRVGRDTERQLHSRFHGTLLGLAVGDALGAAVEFIQQNEIIERYGPDGISDLDEWGGFPAGYYTDDTQMSLATARGLLQWKRDSQQSRSSEPTAFVYDSYLKWRETQHDAQQRRAPGHTCLSALDSGTTGSIEDNINNSKGCGGVMRTAPVGLVLELGDPFKIGAECAAITHGHPSGYLSAGYLSELITRLVRGCDLKSAARATRHSLAGYEGHEETLEFVDRALELADSETPVHDAIEQLGQGWVGEEALAISLYCALRYPDDWKAATLDAVNHSGDSDSTGSICGAILGATLGIAAIPAQWIEQIENRALLEKVAGEMCDMFTRQEPGAPASR